MYLSVERGSLWTIYRKRVTGLCRRGVTGLYGKVTDCGLYGEGVSGLSVERGSLDYL